jgi:hypothetical protein
MANTSIPNLPAIVGLTPSALVWVVQAGTDYSATAQQIASVNPVATTTLAALPAASSGNTGARAFVTDATLSTYSVGAAVAGGGTHVIPVFSNGSSWVAG